MLFGDIPTKQTLGLAAAAVVAAAGLGTSASADRVNQTSYLSNGSAVDGGVVSSFDVRAGDNNTFVISIRNEGGIKAKLNSILFEESFADLTTGLAGFSSTKTVTTSKPARARQIAETTTKVVNGKVKVKSASGSPDEGALIDWTGTASGLDTSGFTAGKELNLTYSYASGVTFSDVEALLGGYGYRVATRVKEGKQTLWASSGDIFAAMTQTVTATPGGDLASLAPDTTVTSVPTPSAFLAGLGLMGLAAMRRRRDEA
jgi:MYXO-CTERM domain-containing protein